MMTSFSVTDYYIPWDEVELPRIKTMGYSQSEKRVRVWLKGESVNSEV